MEGSTRSGGETDGPDPHQALVDKLIAEGHIRTPRVEAAFRAVRRRLFLPGVAQDIAYSNEVVVTKQRENGESISASSQPAIMAIMLEQLALEPGHRVLEIGAGTGYNAALLAHIVGETGRVVTVDIDEDLAEGARAHLAAAGLGRVGVVCADGGQGYAEAAPYDRIILTVGAWDIVPAWREQLKPGGRLVLPLSVTRQVVRSVAFERKEDHLASVSVTPCGFMMLRGAFAAPEGRVALGDEPGLGLLAEDARAVDPPSVYALLNGPRHDLSTTIRVTPREVADSLIPWLQLREPAYCLLGEEGPALERRRTPYLFGRAGKSCSAPGLVAPEGLGLLMRPPDQELPPDERDDTAPFELFVRGFGADSAPARRLFLQARAWDAAGRPKDDIRGIRAYPKNSRHVSSIGERVIHKGWTQLVLEGPTLTARVSSFPTLRTPPASSDPDKVRQEATGKLHAAIRHKDAILVERMLKAGADPDQKDPASGRTAMELAMDFGDNAVLELLKREAGEEVSRESGTAEEPTLEALLEELGGLVGLGNVKADVTQLVNFLRVQKMRKAKGLSVPDQSLHMVFFGNPGTGKTTVARLLARIYKNLGMLSQGHFVETDRAGLVAAYLGQTAIKVREVVGRSLGGVLFIDEAYNLIQDHGGHDPYGHEAVATLLKLMEDHREDLVVIVAGYPALMQRFLRSNPGLPSRFNKYLQFADYSAGELTQILLRFARKSDYRLTEEALARARQLFESGHETRDETFGNARMARNLFEQAINNHASRMVAAASPDADSLMTLHAEDIPPCPR